MELDALEKCTTGAPPGLCSDLGSGPPGPRSILKGKKEGSEERGARYCLKDTPFSFMLAACLAACLACLSACF